ANESRIACRESGIRAYVLPGSPPPNHPVETRDENEQQPRVPEEDLFDNVLGPHVRCAHERPVRCSATVMRSVGTRRIDCCRLNQRCETLPQLLHRRSRRLLAPPRYKLISTGGDIRRVARSQSFRQPPERASGRRDTLPGRPDLFGSEKVSQADRNTGTLT